MEEKRTRREGSCVCPGCQNRFAPKSLHEHTKTCSGWIELYGKPFPYLKYSRTREHYLEGALEGVDYLLCKECAPFGFDFRFSMIVQHLKKVHQMSPQQYSEKYGGVTTLGKILERRVETVQKEYGVDNVFQAEEIKKSAKQTLLRNYGVSHVNNVPEIVEKRKKTNILRYGHENPFGSEEIQKKIRETNLEKYGCENPNQNSDVVKKRCETNRERYGADHFLQTEEFQKKFREKSLSTWGTEHPMQSEEGKKRCEEGCLESFGSQSPFHSPEIQKIAYESNLNNHGGVHSQTLPEVREKAKATWLEKYGVDNPSKSQEVLERIRETWMRNYGVPFPPQSLWLNHTHSFPNKLEQTVDTLSPSNVVYAGDGSYWVSCEGTKKIRNPDFVVLDLGQVIAYQGGMKLSGFRVSQVIEVFGDYWHGPLKTGVDRETHKKDVIEYYHRAGIECLVLWESEIRNHPKRVVERIQGFIGL